MKKPLNTLNSAKTKKLLFLRIFTYIATLSTLLLMCFYETNFDKKHLEWLPPGKGSLSKAAVHEWRSTDGNARIVSFYANKDEFKWRPATQEELYLYREEFPEGIPDYVYAGASLIYGQDPKTGVSIPYITGYIRALGHGFHTSQVPLYSIRNPLHLVIKASQTINGRLEYHQGQPEVIGGFEIPRLVKKPN